MKDNTLTVPFEWLVKAQEITETLATPHRLFDVEAVKNEAGTENPQVSLERIFIECSNTGIRSSLDRFDCTVLDGAGKRTSVRFMVDLIDRLYELYTTAV